jgi:hypothetical protein
MRTAIHHLVGSTRSWATWPLPAVSTKSADEQTRASWARAIYSMDMLPPEMQGAFAFSNTSRKMQYAVLTPMYEGHLHRENEKLVYLEDGCVRILEYTPGNLVRATYPIDAIDYVEAGEILLYAWLKIRGTDDRGAKRTSSMRFNATTAGLFTPILEAIRPPVQPHRSDSTAPCDSFSGWAHSSYKLAQYAHRALLPGEQIAAAILQPEIGAARRGPFGILGQETLAPASAVLVTGTEFIHIEEPTLYQLARDVRYGGIWTYVPLAQIKQVTRTHRPNGTIDMECHTRQGNVVRTTFAGDREREVDAFAAHLRTQLTAM